MYWWHCSWLLHWRSQPAVDRTGKRAVVVWLGLGRVKDDLVVMADYATSGSGGTSHGHGALLGGYGYVRSARSAEAREGESERLGGVQSEGE